MYRTPAESPPYRYRYTSLDLYCFVNLLACVLLTCLNHFRIQSKLFDPFSGSHEGIMIISFNYSVYNKVTHTKEMTVLPMLEGTT